MSSAYYSVAVLHTGKLCWQSVGEDFNGTAWECADLNERCSRKVQGKTGMKVILAEYSYTMGNQRVWTSGSFGMKFILLFLLCRLWFEGCMYLSWGRGQRKYMLYEWWRTLQYSVEESLLVWVWGYLGVQPSVQKRWATFKALYTKYIK